MKMETRIETGAMDSKCTSQSECERRQQFEVLLAKHGIDTVMVSIPRIARALGYAPATLYGYIKNGDFFLPYRVVQGSPMVAVDDFLNWCCSRESEVLPGSKQSGQRPKVERETPKRRFSEVVRIIDNAEENLTNKELMDKERSLLMSKALSRIGKS